MWPCTAYPSAEAIAQICLGQRQERGMVERVDLGAHTAAVLCRTAVTTTFFWVSPFLFPQKNRLQPQRRQHQVRILLQHTLPNSLRHAPGRLIRDAKRPLKLPSANPLRAGTQQIRRYAAISFSTAC